MDDGGMFIKVAAGGSSDGCTDKDWYEVPKIPPDTSQPDAWPTGHGIRWGQVNFGAPVPDKAGPECLIYSESWDFMQNATPTCNKKFTPPDAPPPIREIDTALVIKTNHGNQGIYHSTFGLVGFVAFARSQNLTFPVKNSMVFMNPSDKHVLTREWNFWLSRFGAEGAGRLPSKIQEIAATSFLASALSDAPGMTGVRPLGGKYEDFWTSQVGIPKWQSQDYPVRFKNIYYGRTLDFRPDDFGALRQAIMAKVGMTEDHCRALPDVLVMNRGTIGGQGGRMIVNFDEVVKATEAHSAREGLRVMKSSEFSNLHWKLQLNLSLCSTVMIGSHGGGLTWSYFMKPGSRLIELVPKGSEQCGLKYRASRPGGVATTDFHQFAMGAGHQYDCLKSDTLSEERQQGWAWRSRDIPVDMTKFPALLKYTRQESAERIKQIIKA